MYFNHIRVTGILTGYYIVMDTFIEHTLATSVTRVITG